MYTLTLQRTISSLCGGLCALLLLAATGCGEPHATVRGRVTVAGQPIADGRVSFFCSDGQILYGIIATDGTYTIPNVPYGTVQVTVQPYEALPEGIRIPQKLPPVINGPRVPAMKTSTDPVAHKWYRYTIPQESGLTLTVDRPQVIYDIDLKP